MLGEQQQHEAPWFPLPSVPQPHSRRVKVKCTVQQQVFNGAVLQQQFVTEFVVEGNMCIECNRANTNNESWRASVQLRCVESRRASVQLRCIESQRASVQLRCVSGAGWWPRSPLGSPLRGSVCAYVRV